MALVFFMGSDYASGGLSVAGLDAKINTCSSSYTFFIMCSYSISIFCLISATANSYSICFTRNLAIIFHNNNVRYPGLSCCGMFFPHMFMNRL